MMNVIEVQRIWGRLDTKMNAIDVRRIVEEYDVNRFI